jgi:23S rRNA (pseudouridine1915-N3)-methyltransferase
MKITILAVGKIKEDWLRQGVSQYRKRISKYQSIDIIEIPDAPETLDINRVFALEGDRILSVIKDTDHVITLEPDARQHDSIQLSDRLRFWLETGKSGLVFVIDQL